MTLLFLSTLLAQNTFGRGIEEPTNFLPNSTSGCVALSNLELLISRVMGLMTTIGAILFIIYFLIAAFKWMTAGDSGGVAGARNQIIQATIGLILLVATYAIVGLIGAIVGLKILQPLEVLRGLLPGGGASCTSSSPFPPPLP